MLKKIIIVVLLCSTTFIFSQTKLPSFFSNNMVLQQNEKVSIWGTDKPNIIITVIGNWGNEASVKSDNNGKWKLKIKTPYAGGPYKLTIKGTEKITLNNVLIGEVWLCSGQSNMNMPVKGYSNQPIIGSNDAILNSKNDRIRLFNPERNTSLKPLNNVSGEWNEATPKSVKDFSATAYFFGKKLEQTLNVPIGLIHTSWGGSTVETWMDKETLSEFKTIKFPTKIPEGKVQKIPTLLYNAMLHPFVGYTMKGVIWYQGESNRANSNLYKKTFPTLIKSWRQKWQQGNFPFYFVQIAPFNYKDVNASFLREVQLQTMQNVVNTGMAVTLDIGECKNIHPSKKNTVGKRLAYWALAKDYQFSEIGYSGPIYKEMKIIGEKIKLHFEFAENGLTSFGEDLSGFEIAGEDKIFYSATAKIQKNKTINVWANEVKKPVAVRYAFKNCVKGTLFNTEGLPASSFRTDNWNEEPLKN